MTEKIFLNVTGKSQYDPSINVKYRASACGPTTVHTILNFIQADHEIAQKNINELYKLLGGTKIGLFTWRMISNLRKLLGDNYTIKSCSIEEALNQLRCGYPVAMKFDKWFTFNWFTMKKPLYDYHWVPLIGFEYSHNELYLIFHDNGSRNNASQIRKVKYEDQKHVLRFVKIERN